MHTLYAEVAQMRAHDIDIERMQEIFQELQNAYPNDWLLPLELFELVCNSDNELKTRSKAYLEQLQERGFKKLIENGLKQLIVSE